MIDTFKAAVWTIFATIVGVLFQGYYSTKSQEVVSVTARSIDLNIKTVEILRHIAVAGQKITEKSRDISRNEETIARYFGDKSFDIGSPLIEEFAARVLIGGRELRATMPNKILELVIKNDTDMEIGDIEISYKSSYISYSGGNGVEFIEPKKEETKYGKELRISKLPPESSIKIVIMPTDRIYYSPETNNDDNLGQFSGIKILQSKKLVKIGKMRDESYSNIGIIDSIISRKITLYLILSLSFISVIYVAYSTLIALLVKAGKISYLKAYGGRIKHCREIVENISKEIRALDNSINSTSTIINSTSTAGGIKKEDQK